MTDSLRHEFKFVIEGIELSKEQEQQLSRAVQEAGMRTMASWDLNLEMMSINKLLGGWYGGWILHLSNDVVQGLNRGGINVNKQVFSPTRAEGTNE